MTHLEWGFATSAQFAVRPDIAAYLQARPEQPPGRPYVLRLTNTCGDGLALQGSRRELLEFLQRAGDHVADETSSHGELGDALDRLRTLRAERADLVERYGDTGYGMSEIRRLDESEVDLLNDVAEAAAALYDDLPPTASHAKGRR